MDAVLSVEEVRRLEDLIEKSGTSKAELMEAAGEALAKAVMAHAPSRALILAGLLFPARPVRVACAVALCGACVLCCGCMIACLFKVVKRFCKYFYLFLARVNPCQIIIIYVRAVCHGYTPNNQGGPRRMACRIPPGDAPKRQPPTSPPLPQKNQKKQKKMLTNNKDICYNEFANTRRRTGWLRAFVSDMHGCPRKTKTRNGRLRC